MKIPYNARPYREGLFSYNLVHFIIDILLISLSTNSVLNVVVEV